MGSAGKQIAAFQSWQARARYFSSQVWMTHARWTKNVVLQRCIVRRYRCGVRHDRQQRIGRMSDKIAFLDFGTMCAPMTGRLIPTGHQVIVWNRMEARAA